MQPKNAARKSLCLLIGILLLGISGAGVKVSLAEEKAVNLIKNPGFEEFDKNGNPVAWRWYSNMGYAQSDTSYFEVDKQTFNVLPIGKDANKGKGGNTGKSLNGQFLQSDIEVEGDTLYLLSFKHIEAENFPRNLYICISQFDAAKNSITGDAYYFATDVAPTTTWKTWSKQFKTKPKAATIDLIISPGGNVPAWFDDFSLTKVTEDKPK